MNDQFSRETFKHGLRKLLEPSGHFSICQFETLVDVSRAPVTGDELRSLRLLHCVSYKDMTREMKESLVAKLAEIFARGRDPIAEAADALSGVVNRPQMRVGPSEFLQLVK